MSDRARALVPLARAVERARAKLETLPSVDAARAAFAEASRLAQVSPTGENLDRVAEATKLLQGFAPKRTRAEQDVAQAERDLEHGLRAFVAEARKAA